MNDFCISKNNIVEPALPFDATTILLLSELCLIDRRKVFNKFLRFYK